MKNISLLGSTGSIGKQTLEVAAANPDKMKIRVLAAHTSDTILEEQIRAVEPDFAVLTDKEAAARLKARYHGKTEILAGEEGLLAAATYSEVDTVLWYSLYRNMGSLQGCGETVACKHGVYNCDISCFQRTYVPQSAP